MLTKRKIKDTIICKKNHKNQIIIIIRRKNIMSPEVVGKNILISVDPGYDATKVCVNGIIFKIPACVIDITGKTGNYIGNKKKGFILSSYIEGKECLVGEQARMLLMEPDVQKIQNQKSGMLDSYEKFETQDSEINIMTSIGIALIEYEKLCTSKEILPALDLSKPIDENSPLEIYLAVALPNDALNETWSTVKQQVVGRHRFSLETEEKKYQLDFVIKKENCMANSQVVAALIGSVSDDVGVILDDELDELPVLVIDGGSKTIGDFKLTKNLMVESASSNTDFAMENINKKVAEIINEQYNREDIRSYNIKNILEDGGQLVYENGETTDVVDVQQIVAVETKSMCERYIEYLNNKYNKLLDIKKILVYGGTGAAYYEQILNYVNNHKKHLQGKVHLANYKFIGQQIDPVFAVCIGMYKTLHAQVDEKEANEK